MCAITGLLRFQGRIAPEESGAIRQMTHAEAHRGPDDEGFFEGEGIILGHRRLSILDTSPAGHQPFSNADGTVQVVFNGEIYNFRELRKDLEAAGRRFRSRTDTEVLVQGYEMWGIDGLLPRLRGMFAFALWDAAQARGRSKLFLARDRFGIKPLYYAQNKDRLIFSSEVRALKASGLVRNERDSRSLVQFLQLGSVPGPWTTEKGIQILPPATFLVLNREPGVPKHYWDLAMVLQRPQEDLPHGEAVARTRQLFRTTVEQHLLSDVPLGFFLSGGIDSSALVATAAELQPGHLTTLSVTFEDPGYNEAAFARTVATHYRTRHREILVKHDDFRKRLPGILAAMDQPTIDGVNTSVVSQAAKEAGLTVVLSGLGADELFSGYRHLQKANRVAALARLAGLLPKSLRRGLLSTLGPVTTSLFPRASRKLWCLEDLSLATPWWLARGLFSPSGIARLLGASEQSVLQSQYEAGPSEVLARLTPEGRIRYLEYGLYLQNQLLKDSDVMSMAHSLELRVPFMDHELVEGILRLPSGSSQTPWVPKRLLVEAMGPDFPREIWDRPKQGFTFPMGEWMRQDGGDLEALSLEKTPLQKESVRSVWTDFRAGRLHWSRPWLTLVAARFYGGVA